MVLPPSNHILVLPLASLLPQDAHHLLHAIRIHRDSTGASSSPPSLAPSAPPPSANLVPWTISNRYYTADVAFRVVENVEDILSGEGEEPAVVVLAEAGQAPGESVAAVLGKLAAREPEFEISLLVTLSSSLPFPTSPSSNTSLSASTPDEEAWDDLALSHQLEWIDLSSPSALSSSPSSAHPSSSDEDADDTEELPLSRLITALHSHPWAGHNRHPPQPSTLSSSSRLPPSSTSDDEGAEEDDSALPSFSGGPSLPRARPHVPLKVSFPSTFLPSIRRTGGQAAPAPASAEASEFEDDFSPFVSAPSASIPSSISFSTPREAGEDDDEEPGDLHFPSTASFDASFTGTSDASFDSDFGGGLAPPSVRPAFSSFDEEAEEGGEGRGEDELDALDELFQHLSTAARGRGRGAASAVVEGGQEEEEEVGENELRRRRDRAERLVRELLGGGGVGGSDGELDEDEERP
ncbi:hypothetical protein JCM8547_008871 [Rhodosporidiobolus lusitaniae]